MTSRFSLFSLPLVLATAVHAALPGVAQADDRQFDRFNDRTSHVVFDSTRPYQHSPSTVDTARTATLTGGFNDRSFPVQDSTRPYQRRQPVANAETRIVSRETLFNRFSERSQPIRDSQRPYQNGSYTAQR